MSQAPLPQEIPSGHSTAPPWSPATARIWLVAFGLGLLACLTAIRQILPLAGGALLLAFFISPLVDWMQQRLFGGRWRGLAVASILILVTLSIFGLLLWLVPAVWGQASQAVNFTGQLLYRLLTEPIVIGGEPITDENGQILILGDRLQQMAQTGELEHILNDWAQRLSLNSATVGRFTFGAVEMVERATQRVGGVLISGLLLLVIVFYLLQDWHQLHSRIVRTAPDGYQEDMARLLHELGRVWNHYLRGQVILSLIMGAAMWLIASALGLPHPLIFALIAALMEFIPNIGPTVALLPPAVTALFATSTTLPELSGMPIALLVAGLWALMQQLEAVALVPKIVGGSLHLHPAVMMLAVIWGASVGGVVGIIIAGPIIASVRILVQYVYGRLTGRASFLAPSAESSAPSLVARARILAQRVVRRSAPKTAKSTRQSSGGKEQG
jgi:predicted PurR-regulated permease PerM